MVRRVENGFDRQVHPPRVMRKEILKYPLVRVHISQEELDDLWLRHVGSSFLCWQDELKRLTMLRHSNKVPFTVVTSMYYARSKWWRWIRKQALIRDNFSCVLCGSKERVQVDHLRYVPFGEEKLEDLQAMCLACHAKKTKKFDLYASER